jgi:hypothetical protein
MKGGNPARCEFPQGKLRARLDLQIGRNDVDKLLFAARTIVLDGVEQSGVPLSETLEFHLSTTLAKYMVKPLHAEALTFRLARASDDNPRGPEVRDVADECLIGCALFPERLRRHGSIRYFSGVGQTAYDAIGMTEVALGFPHMLDVLAEFRQTPSDDAIILDMARAGSTRAKEQLSDDNVVVFRPR